MSDKQSYRVLQPVHLAEQGAGQAGESVELKQATSEADRSREK